MPVVFHESPVRWSLCEALLILADAASAAQQADLLRFGLRRRHPHRCIHAEVFIGWPERAALRFADVLLAGGHAIRNTTKASAYGLLWITSIDGRDSTSEITHFCFHLCELNRKIF
ncbi:hypothetical protein Y032_0454g1731 [Ancylostoma ceylanicum]|uniref:Uncharacterized protein n=1 Tax=Ancylostoma ceylanicum TaxID=53326 RepID=A0A016WXW5_9BILA|nr:hypothetical protein Y032_0454g1731 [Ancylostoma ceylanicum]